jgi:hypothetical protein
MSSPYQEFVRKAKERYEANKQKKLKPRGGIEFTAHARYKMSQYGLSEQKVKSVLRNPKRTETGIALKTVAVMQPVGTKRTDDKPARPDDRGRSGRETWKQEIWVMFIKKKKTKGSVLGGGYRIISAWRYPGVSPKRSPVPREILQELESGDILEMFEAE